MRKFSFLLVLILNFTLLIANDVNSTPEGAIISKILSSNDYQTETYSSRQLNITIIESQSINTAHNMDVHWQEAASNLGHTAAIYPQTTLDNTNFFLTTDILIIASGVIDIPQYRRDIVEQFVQQGGNTYIQSEYLSTYHTNQLFQQIVNNTEGIFQWGDTVNGDLQPMQVSGPISDTPNPVSQITYFWYGNEGAGNETILPYMEKDGQFFGFIFTAPDDFSGHVITNSDQDWVRESNEWLPLLENHIHFLSEGNVDTNDYLINSIVFLNQNYPNPFNPITTIQYSISQETNIVLDIFNIKGQLVKTLVNEIKPTGEYSVLWNGTDQNNRPVPSGVYHYRIKTKDDSKIKRMVLLR